MEEIPIVCRILRNNRGIQPLNRECDNSAVDRSGGYRNGKQRMGEALHEKIEKSDGGSSFSIMISVQHNDQTNRFTESPLCIDDTPCIEWVLGYKSTLAERN